MFVNILITSLARFFKSFLSKCHGQLAVSEHFCVGTVSPYKVSLIFTDEIIFTNE